MHFYRAEGRMRARPGNDQINGGGERVVVRCGVWAFGVGANIDIGW